MGARSKPHAPGPRGQAAADPGRLEAAAAGGPPCRTVTCMNTLRDTLLRLLTLSARDEHVLLCKLALRRPDLVNEALDQIAVDLQLNINTLPSKK